jgi:hypothetical protein
MPSDFMIDNAFYDRGGDLRSAARRDPVGAALERDENRAATLEGIRMREAGANYRTGLEAAARVSAARTAIAPEMNIQEGLGDIGTSYRGGRLDLGAIAKKSPVVPAGTGRETGSWEDVGGGLQATAGAGTFNRPAHQEIVGGAGGPVHVLRGTRSTYAGGAPGEEWGSLQRAAQAVNRAAGEGEYVPPGGSLEALRHKNKLEEIRATGKAEEARGGLAAQAQKGATDYLEKMLLQGHGIDEKDAGGKPTGNRMLAPYAREYMLKILPQVKTMEDVPKLLEQAGPELERGKQMDLFNNPATRETSRAQILNNYRSQMQAAGQAPDPNTENYIKTTPVSGANVDWFNQRYQLPKAGTRTPSLSTLAPVKPQIPKEDLWGNRALVAPETVMPPPVLTQEEDLRSLSRRSPAM